MGDQRFSEDGRTEIWESINLCKTCKTQTLPCTKCAYDAGDCTRCFTSSRWFGCGRCNGGRVELHKCSLGNKCPCLGEKANDIAKLCNGDPIRRRLASRYRDSPVLLRLLEEIRRANARANANNRA